MEDEDDGHHAPENGNHSFFKDAETIVAEDALGTVSAHSCMVGGEGIAGCGNENMIMSGCPQSNNNHSEHLNTDETTAQQLERNELSKGVDPQKFEIDDKCHVDNNGSLNRESGNGDDDLPDYEDFMGS